jgi:hypothetical protein
MNNAIVGRNSGLVLSRRRLLQTAAGFAGGTMLPAALVMPVYADDKPAIGTYPAGSSGSSVFIGISVPRTGTYAVQGEDELKGYELAVEHINSGHELIKKISPKTTKGVLGKEVKYGVADSAAKPNEAVQAQQRFISENKAIAITGGTSSAVAVALNKLAPREGAVRVRHLRIERHHRQGLRPLRFPAELLRPDRRGCDHSGPGQGFRQGQESRVSDARLHLRPHRDEIDAGQPGR